jgi:uncharacterized protein (TIGR00730 family)
MNFDRGSLVGLDGGIMKITVFLGSMFGSRPVYKAAVTKLGRWIGKEGHWLVYGGSMTGLMGTLAEAVLSAGGKVTGVEPQMFVEQDLQSDELTELIVVPDIPSRRKVMLEMGDVYIAFPGGTGTLEEISEAISHENKTAGTSVCRDTALWRSSRCRRSGGRNHPGCGSSVYTPCAG